ncbi:Alpha/Beta hydrolase protein [Lineolata rhizophorae]|uniref:Alpha/Beta hydrolase protein n=1 Tax=Lineolata rhizophorae TaxID=578093 RepID=A0A6A6NXU0_9PEZI|nr:Alpha/Beta hydrolase protein [Lineolata rhizophorae]
MNLAAASFNDINDAVQSATTGYIAQGAALCDLIQNKLNDVIIAMDGDRFSGDEKDLVVFNPANIDGQLPSNAETSRSNLEPQNRVQAYSTNYFAKVWLYRNSRLPPHLPPLKIYMPTWPLLCLAAQYSERVYTRPEGDERDTHVAADWRLGTKAMVLKSVPVDDMNTIVLAIRGSQGILDWTVNFRPAPASPAGFLDDPGNLCHSGFLHVARAMLAPVAARLEALLATHPHLTRRGARAPALLLTGHSAGGAVAQLLFAHLFAAADGPHGVSSPLRRLRHRFKRVHCVTFGAPPVSLLPLRPPGAGAGPDAVAAYDARGDKNLFFALVNEGDPVVRADPAVVRSLLRLYSSPAPAAQPGQGHGKASRLKPAKQLRRRDHQKAASWPAGQDQGQHGRGAGAGGGSGGIPPEWPVPESALSLGGRVVLLRGRVNRRGGSGGGGGKAEDVSINQVSDEMLRGVVFGDPMCHMMRLYAERVRRLAVQAVTAGEG